MLNRKPYRTKAQKAEARRTARQDADGAWRSDAPSSIHNEPGVWSWDERHKVPVREPRRPRSRKEAAEQSNKQRASLRFRSVKLKAGRAARRGRGF
jgi:hypothetical protein